MRWRAQDEATAATLIKAGANVDAKDSDGYTPIMLAVSYAKPEVVRLLIENHAKLNETVGNEHRTALGIAIAEYNDTVAKMLRDAGARETP